MQRHKGSPTSWREADDLSYPRPLHHAPFSRLAPFAVGGRSGRVFTCNIRYMYSKQAAVGWPHTTSTTNVSVSPSKVDICYPCSVHEIFRVFAKFFGFKNSVKHKWNSQANGAKVYFCANSAFACRVLFNNIMILYQGVRFPVARFRAGANVV
jgi:hypothetical protein